MVDELERLKSLERQATAYYFIWFTVYLLLGVLAMLLPAVSAMGITFGIAEGQKYLAGFGALAASAFGFFKPNEYAAAFDGAIAEIGSLRMSLDTLSPDEKSKRFDLIYRLMAFKYQGSLPGRPVVAQPKAVAG
jgi:hypothetical protein